MMKKMKMKMMRNSALIKNIWRTVTCISIICLVLLTIMYQKIYETEMHIENGAYRKHHLYENEVVSNFGRINARNIFQKVVIDMDELEQENVPHWDTCPRWFELATSFKSCLLQKLNPTWRHYGMLRVKPPTENIWEYFSQAMELCGSNLLKHAVHAKYLVNSDDIKILVVPYNENATCTSVTIGIGNDTASELKLKDYVPNTTFFGADPIQESEKIFKQIGTFYRTGVSANGGSYKASVLEDGEYSWRLVETRPFPELLLKTMNLHIIDFLLLDIEGAEYDILPQFSANGPLDRNNITVCQLNVELHGPLEDYAMDIIKFSRVLRDFLVHTPFIPIWGHRPLHHQPVFFLNWRDLYCVQKFVKQWCLGASQTKNKIQK